MLSERLKALRTSKGYTQAEAAKLVNISAPAYSAYESGKSIPPLNTVIFFAKHYDVTLDWLCGLKEENNLIDKTVSATSMYSFLISLSWEDKKKFLNGQMKFEQFTNSSQFNRLTPQQKIHLYQEYQRQEWTKDSEDTL